MKLSHTRAQAVFSDKCMMHPNFPPKHLTAECNISNELKTSIWQSDLEETKTATKEGRLSQLKKTHILL